MKEIDERLLNTLTFEVLSAERRNLRSKALTDQKMSEEIQKIIIDNLRTVYQERGNGKWKLLEIIWKLCF